MNPLCAAVELNVQRRAELAKEREELSRAVEEMRVKDEEQRRRYVVLFVPLFCVTSCRLNPCLCWSSQSEADLRVLPGRPEGSGEASAAAPERGEGSGSEGARAVPDPAAAVRAEERRHPVQTHVPHRRCPSLQESTGIQVCPPSTPQPHIVHLHKEVTSRLFKSKSPPPSR